jgi:hypothetical protein
LSKTVPIPVLIFDIAYEFKKTIKIERNKQFQSFLKRKKAVFIVQHVKPTYFGLSSVATALGKATITISELLNETFIHKVVELADPTNPRKMTESKLEIKLSLRQPLIGQHIVKKTQQWMSLRFGLEKKPQLEATKERSETLMQTEPTILKLEKSPDHVSSKPNSIKSPSVHSAKSTTSKAPSLTPAKSKSPSFKSFDVSEETEEEIASLELKFQK